MHAATLLQPLKTTQRVSPLYYDRGQQVVHPGLSYWVRDAESIIFNRGRSVASWTFTGRVGSLNGHPPSYYYLANACIRMKIFAHN